MECVMLYFRVDADDSMFLGKCLNGPVVSTPTNRDVCDCSNTAASCGFYGAVRTCGVAKDFTRGKWDIFYFHYIYFLTHTNIPHFNRRIHIGYMMKNSRTNGKQNIKYEWTINKWTKEKAQRNNIR